MRNFTFKTMLACAALAGMAVATQAQTRVTFEKNSDVSNKFYEVHRAVPLWADFNNDGLMDIYYGGTSCCYGWSVGGYLVKNLGNLDVETVTELKKETIQVEVTDENGNVTYEDQERTIGMLNGLPYSSYGMGSLTLDFNQDGLVDFIFTNRGGNNSGTNKGLVLVKNLGEYQFEVINDEALASLHWGGNESSFNEDQEVGCISVGDYDKDGYPDLVCSGTGDNGRFVKLLRNVDGDHFEFAPVFNPLAWDVETNKVGVYKKTEATVDEDGIEVPGSYIQEPTMEAKPMSHGSVLFADFDNDGWLDIVATGYMDGDDSDPTVGVQVGGDGIRVYRNLQNGEFQDVTDHLCADGETVTDVAKRWGTEDSWLTGVDFNQDGKVDLLITGTVTGRSEKQALLLMNVSDKESGTFAFEESATGLSPISGTTCRLATIVDLNGDDYPDFVKRGWTSYSGWNDWRFCIDYSNGSTQYTLDWFNDNNPGEIGGHFSETMSFGDLDGDNLMDVVASNWAGSRGDTVIFSRNTTEVEVLAPEAPTNVKAVSNDASVIVTWDASSLPNSGNEPLYNLYIKNNETGAVRTIVAANPNTGFQLGYAQFNAYVLSGGEEPTYTFENVAQGSYTVGVQAVSYSYAASEFATATVSVVTGISNVNSDANVSVSVVDDAIVVRHAADVPIEVYSVDGSLVATGVANSKITVAGKGVYVVKVAGQAAKVLK